MSAVAEVLEDELTEATEKKDKKSIRHFVTLIVENFEDMNKRFTMMFTFFTIGFALITLLITIFKFIG